MSELKDFMMSRVRVQLIELLYSKPLEMFYVRQITREIGEEINAVRRELDRMMSNGIIRKEQRGNRLYYTLNTQYYYYNELLCMVSKSTGLGKAFYKKRAKLGKIQFVVFSGKFAKHLTRAHDDIDVLIVGDVVQAEVSLLVQQEEKIRGKEINYTIFSPEEFEFRKQRRDPFLLEQLSGSRIMIVGDEEELIARKPQL
jgi:DNA-binding transcriptional ArsR family regulator